MAHFAKLDENNIVLMVCAVNNAELLDEHGIESENKGIEFLINWSDGYTNWKQTSYNASFRKNYASIGDRYDSNLDAFIPQQPFPSWTLDMETCRYIPPFPFPEDGYRYYWDEENITWKKIE
jgi:hypothetical protein